MAHRIHPRAARGAQGAGAVLVVHALLQPRADDLPHNELRWQGCRVRPVLVRVRGVLSGLEEGPAGVDAPRCLDHLREIRGVISERVRNVLLDVDHGLVEDGPDDEVNELSAHPVIVPREDGQGEDVTRHSGLDDQQDLDHGDDEVAVGHGVLRVDPGQNHRDVVSRGVALLQDCVLVLKGVGQATVQAPLGEERGDPHPHDLGTAGAVLQELLLVRMEQALIHQVAQVVAPKPFPVLDVP
mmetsp:Transcript_6343/g.21779  ORF Transcript_6343/g.21779 Transcript_6343/m.21779 type:complete len:241 (-) Transcript_6343:1449-2171(-)